MLPQAPGAAKRRLLWRVSLSEGLGIAFRRLKATAFLVHELKVVLNEQDLIRKWLHFKVLI